MGDGYLNRIIWVDLTQGSVSAEGYPDELKTMFLGGYGAGARLLYERVPAGADPLGPGNILGFVTGPFTGTDALCGNRFMVVGKSPLTGTWGDANSGGEFGPYLKFAGCDALFLCGAARDPVYVHVSRGMADLKPASDLWGLDTVETEEILRERHGRKARVACIGPAGERLSLIASVMNDRGRTAARSGVGAIMGAKRVKAVVVEGDAAVPVADPDKARRLRERYLKVPDREYHLLSKTGTIGILGTSAMSGDSPVKNWGGAGITDFGEGRERFRVDKVMGYQVRKGGCWRCPIACGGIMEVPEGPFRVRGHKVEYESGAALGSLLLNSDFESIIYLNDLCNRYGLDTISAGGTMAFLLECVERGLVSREEADGLDLEWGNPGALVELLRKMAAREGVGDILADGVWRAAQTIGRGSEEYAIHVHGQELPMHDPRFQPGMATTYLIEGTPGRHCPCEWILPPGLDFPQGFDKYQASGKGKIQKMINTQMQVVNSLGLCQFAYYSYPVQFIPDFMRAIMGMDVDLKAVERIGERILNLRHAFNLREGLNPAKFNVPGRMIGRPPLSSGNVAGVTIDLETQVREFYAELEWDLETGWPSEAKLEELGLRGIVERGRGDRE